MDEGVEKPDQDAEETKDKLEESPFIDGGQQEE
jgi:hypothetical protein